MDSTVSIRFKERPAEPQDLEAVVCMLNETFRQLLGVEAMFTPEEFGVDWSLPGFNLESDTRLVTTPEGEIAGYIEVWDLLNPSVRVNFWGQTHPRFTGLGAGTRLVQFAEQRAARAVQRAPQEARVVLQSYVPSINPLVGPLLEQHGFALIRHALRMVIDLNGTPPQVVLPEGIQIRTFQRGKDDVQMVQAVRGSFKDHFGYVDTPFEEEFQRWQHRMDNDPEFDPQLWFLALDGDQVVGTSLCRYRVEDDPEMSWVSTLGVCRPWRRRGVGLALLQYSFAEFYKRGRRKVGLGVDALSLTGATRLYEKAGLRSDPTRQFDLYEKELRPESIYPHKKLTDGSWMMPKPRRYRHMQDLARMRALLMAGRRAANGSYYVHIGDLNWWLFYDEQPASVLQHVYLWESQDELSGWALLSHRWRTFDVFVHPALRGSQQAKDMYAWAQDQLAGEIRRLGGRDIRTMWVEEHDQTVTQMLLDQGFEPKQSGMLVMVRSLKGKLPSTPIPQGFGVRSVAGEQEAAARAAASYAAFESSWEIQRYVQRYQNFMRTPVYTPELDLVTVTPEGKHASFCLCWPDPVNKIGLFEPVGTHPQYQRQGLGRAVMYEGLRRLRARGMTRAMVCAETDNLPAHSLYESAGFKKTGHLITFSKAI